MHSKAKTYGQVLKEVLQEASKQKRKTLFQNFKNLLKKRGDLRLLSKAVQEFKRLWENREGKIGTVVFATSPSEKMRKAAAKAFKRQGFVYEEKVDPGLVGGAEIFLGSDYLIDNSIKRKLERITHIAMSVNQPESA